MSKSYYSLLFSNHRLALLNVFNAVFTPDLSVKVVTGDQEGKEGVIRCVNFPHLTVESKELKTFTVEYSNVEVVYDGYEILSWTRYVDEEVANRMIKRIANDGDYEKPLHSFIKESHYLEVINEENPREVEVAQVLENRCGLLKLKYDDGKEEHLHMSSSRLKPLGWVEYVPRQFTKGKNYSERDDLIGVPPFCFDILAFDVTNSNSLSQWSSFTPHKNEEGHVMVVIDPTTNCQFLPAIVTKVYNLFFYKLSLLEDCSKPIEQWKTLNRCNLSSDIFPFGQGHRDKCSTSLPKGIASYDKLTVEEISRLIDFDGDLVQAPANRFPLYNLISESPSNPIFECDSETFSDPGLKSKLSGQLIEVYLDNDYAALHFGRILRTTKHFLFVSIETFGKYSPPKIISLTNPDIFPLGYSSTYNIPIYFPKLYLEPLLIPIDIEKYYTSDPTLNDNRDYISPLWLDGKIWCPKIYVNRKCYAGPFVDEKRLWRLENSYGPGPLPKVLECLISDFVTICEGSKLMHILDAKKLDNAFTLPAKYYSNSDNDRQHSSTNVVNFTFVGCRNVEFLPQWLNVLCRTIDACPGFISTVNIEGKCQYDCCSVPQLYPYMLPETHVNTAYSLHVAKDRSKQKKRRTIVEQLQNISPRRKRSRINATSFEPNEEFSDEESRSSSPAVDQSYERRRTISSTIVRPTIVRPVKASANDSSDSDDSVIEISDDDDDEECPTLLKEANVNEQFLYQRNSQNGTNGMINNGNRRYMISPSLQNRFQFEPTRPGVFRAGTVTSRAQLPTLGPKIRYPMPARPSPSTLIMDPRKMYRPTRPQNISAPIRPIPIRPARITTAHNLPTPKYINQTRIDPDSHQIRLDPTTGKYLITPTTQKPNVPKKSAITVLSAPTSSSPPAPLKVSPKVETPPSIASTDDSSENQDCVAFPTVQSDPRSWRVAQVSAWIAKSYEKDLHYLLFQNRVTGSQLLALTTYDLSQMGIAFGRALKLQDLIRKLRVFTENHYGKIEGDARV